MLHVYGTIRSLTQQVDALSAKVNNAMQETESKPETKSETRETSSRSKTGASASASAGAWDPSSLPATRDTGSRRQRTPVRSDLLVIAQCLLQSRPCPCVSPCKMGQMRGIICCNQGVFEDYISAASAVFLSTPCDFVRQKYAATVLCPRCW